MACARTPRLVSSRFLSHFVTQNYFAPDRRSHKLTRAKKLQMRCDATMPQDVARRTLQKTKSENTKECGSGSRISRVNKCVSAACCWLILLMGSSLVFARTASAQTAQLPAFESVPEPDYRSLFQLYMAANADILNTDAVAWEYHQVFHVSP